MVTVCMTKDGYCWSHRHPDTPLVSAKFGYRRRRTLSGVLWWRVRCRSFGVGSLAGCSVTAERRCWLCAMQVVVRPLPQVYEEPALAVWASGSRVQPVRQRAVAALGLCRRTEADQCSSASDAPGRFDLQFSDIGQLSSGLCYIWPQCG